MEQITKYLIIIASLMTVKLTVTESKNDTNIKLDRIYYHSPIFINICDISDRRAKVHCYCDSNKQKLARTADCWVFSGGITEDDPIWPSFSSQPDIDHLMFNVRSDDALNFVPAKAIVRLDRLRYLSIQFGTIKRIPPYAFTNSSTIRKIILKSNKISTLERHSFAQMMLLSNLSLEDNQISELRTDVFFNLPNLHYLYLSNNNISLIHEGCFKHLNNLLELNLDNNYISVITREMFEGLENLARLNLRNNKLAMIGNLAFSKSWSLKELFIDNNAIEYISDRAFGGLTLLRKLTLSGNKLTTFYEDVLEDIRELTVLDLRDNLLQTISYETIRPVVANDKSVTAVVYLDGNPLNCNCRLSWVYVLRNETKHSNLRNALEKISCVVDTSNDRHSSQEDIEHEQNENVLADDSYDYYDKNEDFNNRKVKVSKAQKLIDIPLESLPCPKEIMQSIEESYGHPVQNEIRLKAFSSVGRIAPSLIVIIMLIMF